MTDPDPEQSLPASPGPEDVPERPPLLRTRYMRRYLIQCGIAGLVVLLLLLVLDAMSQTVLIAALAASAFIAFALPRAVHSGPRHMIGGYLAGLLCGVAMASLNLWLDVSHATLAEALVITFGALATALAMLLMVVTRTEHPPAAALALGLVLNPWDGMTLIVILIGIVALTLAKQLVLPMLMDIV